MTVAHFKSEEGARLLTGLSSDKKPVASAEGAIFIETDTARVFRFTSRMWVDTYGSTLGRIATVVTQVQADQAAAEFFAAPFTEMPLEMHDDMRFQYELTGLY